MRMDIAAQSDIGRQKKNNEDHYGVFREDTPDLRLFDEGAFLCVADGLGGHVGGEIASKLAVSVFKDCLKEPPPEPADRAVSPAHEQENGEAVDPYDTAILNIMRAAIVRANESIFLTNRDVIKSDRPMGTTLLGALVLKNKVYIANVGDSRGYQLRNDDIIAVTEDHSWVDEQVKLGLMSRAEAESDSRRHLVTRSIGIHPEVMVDTYVWNTLQGDKLLLCTDGLVNMVRDADILDAFRKRGTAAELAHQLVDLANANGGRDNTTVIVAYLSPNLLHFLIIHLTSFFRTYGKKLLWTIMALLFAAVWFFAGYYVRDFNLWKAPALHQADETPTHPIQQQSDESSNPPN